jgi:hypothetical protein
MVMAPMGLGTVLVKADSNLPKSESVSESGEVEKYGCGYHGS